MADMQWNVRSQRRQECRAPPVFTLINILLTPAPQNAGKAKLGSQEHAAQLGHNRLTDMKSVTKLR